ncbi:MAG: hypothetical protein V1676_03660 [Candidatus Diapherotrites archaeon]
MPRDDEEKLEFGEEEDIGGPGLGSDDEFSVAGDEGLAGAGGAGGAGAGGGTGLLGGIYSKIEGAFFGIMDALQNRGIPVYSVIEPLENRGIPFFPMSIALAIVVLFLAYGFFFAQPQEVRLNFTIIDAAGEPLGGVSVNIAGGGISERGVFKDQQVLILKGAHLGTELEIKATRAGYAEFSKTMVVSGSDNAVYVQMKKEAGIIVGKIKLIDAETDDTVAAANVTAEFADGSTVNCNYAGNGIVECAGVAEGEKAQLHISTSNYEDKDAEVAFYADRVDSISLEPKGGANAGTSNLIVKVTDADTKLPLSGAGMQVYDAASNALISEVKFDAEYGEAITKGTSVRIVVSADGYETYDSGAAAAGGSGASGSGTSGTSGGTKTMRNDEEPWNVALHKGGTTMHVTVQDASESGLPLSGAKVMLFNSKSELLQEYATKFGGDAEFAGLEPLADYYATAYKDGYLPSRITAKPSEKKGYKIELEKATTSNSGLLEITAEDSFGNIGNDTLLNIYEIVGGKNLPLGIAQQRCDYFGKANITIADGKTVYVSASKGVESGEGTATITANSANQIAIKMRRPAGVVLLVLMEEGTEVSDGNVLVKTGAGQTLLNAQYKTGGIEFVAGTNKFVKLTYTYPDGKTFREEVNVSGKERAEVQVSREGTSAFAPKLEFLGITDASGREVEGLAKGMDYYLKFRLEMPEGEYKGGMHVRLGEDSVKYADSMDAGIIGFSAVGAGHTYGRTYSPLPEPGYEGIDYMNRGQEGKYNKWLELYFKSGGSKNVKVRVKAKETATSDSIALHYRAWTEGGEGAYYREPADEALGNERANSLRSSLYAETKTAEIKIFDEFPNCENELCTSYKFVREDGTEYETADFKAAKGGLYALEIEVNPREAANLAIKGSTVKASPKIAFQGYAINNFAEFPDTNSSDTSIEAKDIALTKDKAVKVRLYFKVLDIGNTHITVQALTQKSALTENFYFNSYVEKGLSVTVLPAFVATGKDFEVIVKGDAGEGVENAVLKFRNAYNELLRTVSGDGTKGNGMNGSYTIKNSFDAGKIELEVSADGYKPATVGIEIGKAGVLELPAEVRIMIPKGQGSAETRVAIKNNSASIVQNLTFEVKPKGGVPDGMEISVAPVTYISANSVHYVTFRAEYRGSEERVHAGAEVIARGTLEGKYPVNASTNVIADYNPKLDSECLELSKEKLVVYLASGISQQQYYSGLYNSGYYATQDYLTNAQGYNNQYYSQYGQSSYNPTQDQYYQYNAYTEHSEVKVTLRNKCNIALTITPEAVAAENVDSEIKIELDKEITLEAAGSESGGRKLDEKEITVIVTDSVMRNYDTSRQFDYEIFFRSDALTKSLPLEVYIWNPAYALQANRNIELWLAESVPGQQATAATPLLIRNVGQADIENINFQVVTSASAGSTTASIEPRYATAVLHVGESITPPPVLVAKAIRDQKATPGDVVKIDIKGTIGGRSYYFGPINVTTHVSPPECIKVTPSDVSFSSTVCEEGALERDITITNHCADAVSIRGISPDNISGNMLVLGAGAQYIEAGREVKAKLVLDKRQCYDGPTEPVVLKGFLMRTQRWIDSNPINLNVKIGKRAGKAETAAQVVTVEVCATTGKKETREVSFPVIAAGANCDRAYCDAQQMAQYLAGIIETKIKDVKRQVASYGADAQKAQCGNNAYEGYCTFESLGIGSADMELFFQNDTMSDGMLESEMEKKGAELKGYSVEYTSPGANAGRNIGAYGKRVWLTDSFTGCGRYVVNVTGAVRVQGARLMPDYISVVVEMHPEKGGSAREITEQCTPKIQNIMNFLPVDKGYGTGNSQYSWLGTVVADEEEYKSLGEEVAKSLFGDKKRFVESSSTNRLEIRKGVDEGYVAKVSMERVGDAQPMAVYANIKVAAGAKQQDIATEAAKAIRGLGGASIDGCIAPEGEDNYFLLRAATGMEELEIGECTNALGQKDVLNVLYNKESCCEFTVYGVMAETITVGATVRSDTPSGIGKVTVVPVAPEPTQQKKGESATTEVPLGAVSASGAAQQKADVKSVAGEISSPTGMALLADEEGAADAGQPDGTAENPPANGGTATPQGGGQKPAAAEQGTGAAQEKAPAQPQAKPAVQDSRAGKYAAKMKLCVTGNQSLQLAQGKEILINAQARSKAKSQLDAKTRSVKVQVCGINPNRLAGKMEGLKAGDVRYAMLVWEGAPDSLTLNDIKISTDAEKLKASIEAKINKNDFSEVKSEDAQMKQDAILYYYMPACSATAAVLGFLTKGWPGIFIEPTVDCVIPGALAYLGQTSYGNRAKENLYGYFENIKGLSPEIIKPYLGWLESFMKGNSPLETGNTEGAVDDARVAATVSISARAAGKIVANKWEAIFPKSFTSLLKNSAYTGIITGALSNAAGLYFYDKHIAQETAKKQGGAVQTGNQPQNVDTTGDGKNDTTVLYQGSGITFDKYGTYKISRTKQGLDVKDVYEPVAGLPEGTKPEQMLCDAQSMSLPAGGAGILPDPNRPPSGAGVPQHYYAIFNYLDRYSGMIHGASVASGVPEALLVTVAIWKGELDTRTPSDAWITGCNAKAADAKAWSAADKSFGCAAKQLGEDMASCGGDYSEEMVTCALKLYNNRDSDKGANQFTPMSDAKYAEYYAIFSAWNAYPKGATGKVTAG